MLLNKVFSEQKIQQGEARFNPKQKINALEVQKTD
jgi:hypothetical protein